MDVLCNFLLILFLSISSFLWGSSVLKKDLNRHSICHVRKTTTIISILLFFFFCVFLVYAFFVISWVYLLISMIIFACFSFILVYIVSKMNPSRPIVSIVYYLLTTCIVFYAFCNYSIILGVLWGVYYGFWINNSPFSAPHKCFVKIVVRYLIKPEKRKITFSNDGIASKLYSDYLINKNNTCLQNFSYAGYKYGNSTYNKLLSHLTIYDVREYGIQPNRSCDYTEAIQNLIDSIGGKGGGILFFPNGTYNVCKKGQFLQINHSNIIIKGESKNTVFVSHTHTFREDKNPWLSPFLFTTGEKLQRSNIFWGVQFKEKKSIVTRSGSLTDPGSDGSILEPPSVAKITKAAQRGEQVLNINNSEYLKNYKYIIIALYNTEGKDDLIKEILDVDILRDEWGTAKRVTDEEAPSFQSLVEIEDIIDNNKIKLCQPLRRDVALQYAPEIFGVDMLEQVGFLNFTVKSKWNGLFRHHGFPLYFSKKESQIMDYGWNAINMKRVAHGFIDGIVIDNYTNPLYVQDSRNITIENVLIKGSSGHQGIKLYGHAADNLFSSVRFETDYADMMGGEGNCYGNVFTNIDYSCTENIYVDFDFHGFSDGPFSPPAFNLFENIYGFRGIKGGGALYNQPACAAYNVWWNIFSEGYDGSSDVFINSIYSKKTKFGIFLSSFRHAVVTVLQERMFTVDSFVKAYKDNVYYLACITEKRKHHYRFFKSSIISGYTSDYKLRIDDSKNEFIIKENFNTMNLSLPYSLYNAQKKINAR